MVEKEKIIDKKVLPTIIALGVLVILGLVVMLGKSQPSNSKPSEDVQLLKFKPAEINYIFFEDKVNDYINAEIVKKEDGNWYVNGKLAYTPEVMRILNVLSSVKKYSQIDDYNNLKDYKLQPYIKRLVMKFKDKSKPDIELFVGDYAPVSKKRYVKFLDDKTIHLADKFVYSAMAVTPEGLLNKDIFGLNPENLKAIIIQRNKDKYELNKEKFGWYVTLPSGEKTFADQNVVKNIINILFGNAATAVIDISSSEELLKNFKLPYMTIKAFNKEGDMAEVKVSPQIPSTTVFYLLNVESKKIFVLSKAMLERTIFNSFDIRNKKLFIPKLSDFETITIIKDGKEFLFKKDNHNLWSCKKLSIDNIATTSYIEDLYSLYADRFTNDLIKGSLYENNLQNPVLEIIVKLVDSDEPYKITIAHKKTDGYYPTRIDNEPFIYFIDKSTFKLIDSMGYKEPE